MKFIYEKEKKEKQLTLKDVAQNQFFVCTDGYLCQKEGIDSYLTIADCDGEPSCACFSCCVDMPIKRIIPHVKKIEF